MLLLNRSTPGAISEAWQLYTDPAGGLTICLNVSTCVPVLDQALHLDVIFPARLIWDCKL